MTYSLSIVNLVSFFFRLFSYRSFKWCEYIHHHVLVHVRVCYISYDLYFAGTSSCVKYMYIIKTPVRVTMDSAFTRSPSGNTKRENNQLETQKSSKSHHLRTAHGVGVFQCVTFASWSSSASTCSSGACRLCSRVYDTAHDVSQCTALLTWGLLNATSASGIRVKTDTLQCHLMLHVNWTLRRLTCECATVPQLT